MNAAFILIILNRDSKRKKKGALLNAPFSNKKHIKKNNRANK